MSMQKNIRVCQVLHGIVGGGSEQVVLNYCSRMHDIHFDLLFQYEPNPQILEHFNEARINCIQIPDKVHHPFKHLWTMFRIFRKGNYEVVHSHLDWFMNSYVCFLAMLAGVKKRIAHHHQAYHPTNPLLILLCALMRIPCKLFATHWLACGEAAAINGWGKRAFEKSKVTILPNAIDPERFKFNETARHEIRVKYGIAENDFVVGHVGRFFPEKNHEFLVEVFAEMLKRAPSMKLLLLGDGPLQERIKQKIEALGISKSVILAGLQKFTMPFYCAMDIFCLPSLREALGIVLLEAQYNGLPCVVCDCVPKEVDISSNIMYLPLQKRMWIETLFELSENRVRKLDVPQNNKYDINLNEGVLRALYG